MLHTQTELDYLSEIALRWLCWGPRSSSDPIGAQRPKITVPQPLNKELH